MKKVVLMIFMCLIFVGCKNNKIDINLNDELKASENELICIRQDEKRVEKIVLTFMEDKITNMTSIDKFYISNDIDRQFKNIEIYVNAIKEKYNSVYASASKDGNIISREISYEISKMPEEFLKENGDILKKTKSEYKKSAEKSGAICSE